MLEMDFVNKKELDEILLSEMNEKEMIQAVLDLSLSDEGKSHPPMEATEKTTMEKGDLLSSFDLVMSSYSLTGGSGHEEISPRLSQGQEEKEDTERHDGQSMEGKEKGIGSESRSKRRVIVIKTRDGKSKTFLVNK